MGVFNNDGIFPSVLETINFMEKYGISESNIGGMV